MRKAIPVKEAIDLVIQNSYALPIEEVALADSYGRILAEDIIAKNDVPPFNRSAYDGYAVRAIDTSSASEDQPVAFKTLETIGAGYVPEKPLESGEAYRIMTGAILPQNADAIVMVEKTESTEAGFLLREVHETGQNISFQGEDVKQGEVQIEKGEKIHPGTIALLATFGYARVKVARRPKVSVISTGTELLDVTQPLEPGKIRNSNGPMLCGQLERLNVPYRSLGMMEDDLDACTAIVEKALEESDIVMTTGGVSVGDFDYLPEIYKRIGATVLFNKVMMRPGSVTTVAVKGKQLLFGLSGNPSACFSGFELFARPAILSQMNCKTPYLPLMQATLGEDYGKKNPFSRFVRAKWIFESGQIIVRPAGFNKSNAVSSIAKGNCIIALPPESEGYQVGDTVDVLLLGEEQGAETWQLS